MSSPPARTLLLLNERAANDDELRQAIAGQPIVTRQPSTQGEARRLAAEWEGTVVACGGDGTLNEVINGVLEAGKGSAVGVIPFGTANDFATAAGISALSRAEQLRLVLETEPTPIDVGLINDRYFVNVASIGFGAEVTAETPPLLKSILGGFAYTLTAAVMVVARSERRVVVTSDDRTWEGNLLLLAVANARLAGGGYQVAPRSSVIDGLLDVTLFPDPEWEDFPDVVAGLAHALAEGNGDEWPGMQSFRVTSLEVRADSPLAHNLDGEPDTGPDLSFRVVPKAVPFFLPRGCPLLTNS